MPYDIVVGRDESDKVKFGSEGLIYIGKGFVKMGQTTSMSNRILMDVARSHVVLVVGKRGSGKSYTLGVIAEEMANLPSEVAQNIAVLMFDTMGIFWTMSYKNEKEEELLKTWGIEGKALPVKVFVPYGQVKYYQDLGIPVSKSFAIKVSEMMADDWVTTFGLDMLNPVSILVQKIISKLHEELSEQREDFDIDTVIERIHQDSDTTSDIKSAAANLFEAARSWGLFSKKGEEGTAIKELVEGGKTSIIDLSVYSSIGTFNVRSLVIGLITKKL